MKFSLAALATSLLAAASVSEQHPLEPRRRRHERRWLSRRLGRPVTRVEPGPVRRRLERRRAGYGLGRLGAPRGRVPHVAVRVHPRRGCAPDGLGAPVRPGRPHLGSRQPHGKLFPDVADADGSEAAVRERRCPSRAEPSPSFALREPDPDLSLARARSAQVSSYVFSNPSLSALARGALGLAGVAGGSSGAAGSAGTPAASSGGSGSGGSNGAGVLSAGLGAVAVFAGVAAGAAAVL
ncbi:hypothetical protein DMC30DRAFT_164550 [Rhodotorula diobovata]|uniref:Proteophosphoglycan ppg4 n=1 Tax=Rhodotorula diobovata TaxID=5288 RepID=A0A5C5G796_9BASI|nr:hypothetical protein DMC30DRAFT_164550 [Rhodotorula diobovata]